MASFNLQAPLREHCDARLRWRTYRVWAGKGERVTEQQHRHQGPMRTADDQQTNSKI